MLGFLNSRARLCYPHAEENLQIEENSCSKDLQVIETKTKIDSILFLVPK